MVSLVQPTLFSNTNATYNPPANEYELRIVREKRGHCATCGIQTHKEKRNFFINKESIPLTNDKVSSGRCLICNPIGASVNVYSSVPVGKASEHSSMGIEDADDAVPEISNCKDPTTSASSKNDVNIAIQDSAAICWPTYDVRHRCERWRWIRERYR
jgi:hypothetical protein